MKRTTFFIIPIILFFNISRNQDEWNRLQSELESVTSELKDCHYELEEDNDKISEKIIVSLYKMK